MTKFRYENLFFSMSLGMIGPVMPRILLDNAVVKPKPWGREIWFAHTDKYTGKILEMRKGHRFSLQYHKKKCETQLIIEGKVKFTFGKNPKKLQEAILCAGDKADITPGMIHRVEALKNTIIFEVSTPELDDVIKLEDDYGRKGAGNDEKLDAQLAAKHKKSNRPSHSEPKQ